jgi:hypothetical protein
LRKTFEGDPNVRWVFFFYGNTRTREKTNLLFVISSFHHVNHREGVSLACEELELTYGQSPIASTKNDPQEG